MDEYKRKFERGDSITTVRMPSPTPPHIANANERKNALAPRTAESEELRLTRLAAQEVERGRARIAAEQAKLQQWENRLKDKENYLLARALNNLDRRIQKSDSSSQLGRSFGTAF